MNNWIKFGMIAAVAWYGILRGAKGLMIAIKDYTLNYINLSEGTVGLSVQFVIKNPLLIGLTLSRIEGQVFAQGQQVGTIDEDLNYYIAGGRTHILPVNVELLLSSVQRAAMANIESGDIHTFTVDFDGKLYVSNYKIPVPIQFSFNYGDLIR